MNELSLNRHTQTKTGTKHKLNEDKKTTHWKTKRKMYTKSKQEKKTLNFRTPDTKTHTINLPKRINISIKIPKSLKTITTILY